MQKDGNSQKYKKENLEVKNTNKNEECFHNGLPIRWDLAEERICKLENITVRISKAKIKIKIKTGKNIQELRDNFKMCNICIMGKPEGEERETRTEAMKK